MIYLDTETFLGRPGLSAPPLVCVQWVGWAGAAQLIHARDPACYALVRGWLETSQWLIGHNVAYDMAVICAQWPDLTPLVFRLYHAGRITCTVIREKLIRIALGPPQSAAYDLGSVAAGYGRIVDKSDPWRMRYGTLIDTPVADWPTDAIEYALLDAQTTRDVYAAQTDGAATAGIPLEDQWRQSRAAFALHLTGAWGMRTDVHACIEYERRIRGELDAARAAAAKAGLVRSDGTRDTRAAAGRMTATCERLGIDIPVTDTGRVRLDDTACTDSADPALIAYQEYGSSGTTIARVARMYRGAVYPLQTRYDSLKETGRTSTSQGVDPGKGDDPEPFAWGVQVQNNPREANAVLAGQITMRQCFVPRAGHVFCSLDFDQIELKCWAQACLWLLGKSRLAEVLNEGRDPHTLMGARIAGISESEAESVMRGEHGHDAKNRFKLEARQVAKIVNFGLPGGMGPAKLAAAARSGYGVRMSVDDARARRRDWLATWPEAAEYFAWVDSTLDRTDRVAQLRSNRVRGGLRYTTLANTLFQGLAADGAKAAAWELCRAMYDATVGSVLYGARTVAFIHDEYLAELRQEHAHEQAAEMTRIVVDEMQSWVPDVRITAAPALMRKWSKSAEPVYRDGRLIPYEDA